MLCCPQAPAHWNPPCFTSLCSLQRSARAAAENSDAIFSELIRSIELKRFEVRELVKAQEKRAIDLAEQLLEKMRTEIAELKANEAELNKLATVEDNIQFLQVSASLFSICFRDSFKPSTSLALLCPSRVARLSELHLCSQFCLRLPPSLAWHLTRWWRLYLILKGCCRRSARTGLSASTKQVSVTGMQRYIWRERFSQLSSIAMPFFSFL